MLADLGELVFGYAAPSAPNGTERKAAENKQCVTHFALHFVHERTHGLNICNVPEPSKTFELYSLPERRGLSSSSPESTDPSAPLPRSTAGSKHLQRLGERGETAQMGPPAETRLSSGRETRRVKWMWCKSKLWDEGLGRMYLEGKLWVKSRMVGW